MKQLLSQWSYMDARTNPRPFSKPNPAVDAQTPYDALPHGWAEPEEVVDYVLAPVAWWPSRLRTEMISNGGGAFPAWDVWCGMGLIRQTTSLAGRGIAKDTGLFLVDRYSTDSPLWFNRETVVERALDWIYGVYRRRLAAGCGYLAVRARPATPELCDLLAERLDYSHRLAEFDDMRRRQNAAVSLEDSLAATSAMVEHELFPVSPEGAAIGGEWIDVWRRWETEAWYRFVEAVDWARLCFPGTHLTYDDPEIQRVYSMAVNTYSRESQTERLAPKAPPGVGGYHASEYAADLVRAFARDPEQYRQAGRAAFKKLSAAADLSNSEMRTVKRRIGYEGDARGFEHFVKLLYGATGETPPE